MKRFPTMLFCFAAAASLATPSAAQSQAYPSKPIKVVLGFPPGSSVDLTGRLVASKVTESIGQSMIMEYRAGAQGMIGGDYVARAAPDGYTLLITTTGPTVVATFMSKNIPYDAKKDFTPITAAVESVLVVAVNPSLPVNSFKDFVGHLKANPGKVRYGTSGIGSVFHLVGEVLKESVGAEIVHVPYKGIIQAVQDVVAGRTEMAFTSANSATPLAKAGKLKILAVVDPVRFDALPDTPAASEVLPGFERPATWFGYLGPAGLPSAIARRVQQEIAKALNQPDIRPKLEASGLRVIANTPEEFRTMYLAGFDQIGRIVKAAGIEPQ